MDLHPYYPLLARTPLLRGMRPDELDTLLDCFAPRVRRYARDEILLLAGYETREVGILLEGSITAVKNTPDGASVAHYPHESGRLVRGCAFRFQPKESCYGHGHHQLPCPVSAIPEDHPPLRQAAQRPFAADAKPCVDHQR